MPARRQVPRLVPSVCAALAAAAASGRLVIVIVVLVVVVLVVVVLVLVGAINMQTPPQRIGPKVRGPKWQSRGRENIQPCENPQTTIKAQVES